jgi:arylsulfatase
VFHAGVGHIPSDVAPDVRGRGYLIEAEVFIDKPDAQGVLIAHGDATSGYSLFVRNGRLVHDMNIGGQHHVVESDRPVPRGHVTLGFELKVGPLAPVPPPPAPMHAMVPAWRSGTLLIDGQAAGSIRSQAGFNNFVSWSGLDIGRDRSSPVSTLYDAPFEFTGRLVRVTVTLDAPQGLDGDAVGHAEMARQ